MILENYQVGNKLCIAIAESLKYYSNLKCIWLVNNNITDEGISTILIS